jgi:hypothetical protein
MDSILGFSSFKVDPFVKTKMKKVKLVYLIRYEEKEARRPRIGCPSGKCAYGLKKFFFGVLASPALENIPWLAYFK